MSLISLGICLSDIPKEKIRKHENGKFYVNLVVVKRKEESQYGETHAVAISKTKEEREANVETIYCGSGKEFVPESVTPVKIESLPPLNEGDFADLPF